MTSCIWILLVLWTNCLAKELTIQVRSEGCEDKGRGPGCGVATIKVNGIDYSTHKRGYNFVVLDGATGDLKTKTSFDTFTSLNEVNNMIKFVNGLSPNLIVITAIQDEASTKMTPQSYQVLLKIGAVEPMYQDVRGSFALIGFSGPGKPSFVKQLGNRKGQGPSSVEAVIPIGPTKYTIVVKTGTKSRTGTLDGPGTDAAIKVMLYGISKTTNQEDHTEPLKLSGSILRNHFESGQTDIFKNIKDMKVLTSLNKVQIKRSNFGIGPDWLLDKLTVTTEDGKSYDFNANIWLTEKGKYYDVAVASTPASPAASPAKPATPASPASPATPSKSAVIYDIIVYTGTTSDSSSSANIYLTIYGAASTGSEVHLKSPNGQQVFTAASSKVFQAPLENLGPLTKIKLRQDGLGSSPNWKVDKIMIIVQEERIFEFHIANWLEPNKPLEKTLTNEFPATSIKFNAYPPCVHSLGSKIHPDPKTALVLNNGCSKLATFFRLLPDGVIIHLASGMCVQGEITGDPKNLPSNSKVILSTQCTLYFPGVDIPHALQFKFTPGGSLREIKSGKCITSTQGSLQTPLTFSDSCDTAGNKISFVDKSGTVILPEKKGLSPPATKPKPKPDKPKPVPTALSPVPPAAPSPPSTGSIVKPGTGNEPALSLVDPTHPEYGGNNSHVVGGPLPTFCGGGCSSACQPSCTQPCCGGQQPAAFPQANSPQQPTACPRFCTPANCRSTCHIDCCTPKADINIWQAIMMRNSQSGSPTKKSRWD